jgi:hypothetical protein
MNFRCSLIILVIITAAFGDESGRKGLYFTIGHTQGFAPAIVFTSYEQQMSSGKNVTSSFPKYNGTMSAELHLGHCSGLAASSFVSSFTWFYPSAIFDYSVFTGYAFTRYSRLLPPSIALEFLIGPELRMTGPKNLSALFIGGKTGIRLGYEFNQRITGWAGVIGGYGFRSYTVNCNFIDLNDNTNTIKNLGKMNISENMILGTLSAGVSYSF